MNSFYMIVGNRIDLGASEKDGSGDSLYAIKS